jgi:hypothetical protein
MDEKTFTDEQVTAACNLHIDNLRRLITWGAVRPVQGGGGRGRVRLWDFRQAMRIAVTAEFFEAGFSLQMAHTLTYCLPFDDLLHIYDPKFLVENVDQQSPKDAYLRAMMNEEATNYWPPGDAVGGEIWIINRRFVYADLLGDTGHPFGIIDPERNRFYPMVNPTKFYWGVVTQGRGKRAWAKPAIQKIDRQSLLLDDAYFSSRTRGRIKGLSKLPILQTLPLRGEQIDVPEERYYRSLLKINMNVGLVGAFRGLLGFPVSNPLAGEDE